MAAIGREVARLSFVACNVMCTAAFFDFRVAFGAVVRPLLLDLLPITLLEGIIESMQ